MWNKISYLAIANFDIDEGLPSYFHSIDENDLKWTVFEECYSREIMNLKTLDDMTLNIFKSVREEKMNGTEQ